MSWKHFLEEESKKDYFKNIIKFVQEDSKLYTIYPNHKDIFNAFKYCSLDYLKVVILGLDPYINENQAHGLSFSVPKGIAKPPSLKNIFKELKSDVGIDPPDHGCLIDWAKQGILLLNTFLTVRKGETASHSKIGWETFSDNTISFINDINCPIVFILWGTHAKSKKKLITNDSHLIIESVHPSPLSAHNGFFGSKPFSKTNEFLVTNNMSPIDWKLSS